jgi:protein-disulfide isomerase
VTRQAALAAVALSLVVGALVAPRALAQDEPVRYRIPVTRHEPSVGPEDALVTLVVFSDFECPFCSRVEPTLDQLRAAYPRDLRVVFRNVPLPFHDHARLAAQAAMEAFAQGGNAAFWRMHRTLFANQRALERADLERYATELRLNLPRFRRALDEGTHVAEIEADEAIARLFAVRGTPNFMINGRPLTGAQPFSMFDEIVRDEVRRAQALVSRGTPRARVYAEMTRNGRERGEARPEDAPAAPRRTADPSAVYAVPIGSSPVRGTPEALVTIVEFTDLQCPFCARVQPTLAALAREYGSEVRFVLKHNPLPFHPRAQPIARLLVWAAARGKVWPLLDRIFQNQSALTDDDLASYAAAVGLDGRGARAALTDTSLDAAIRADQDLALSLGASGTPSFFINGRSLRGAQPLEAFRALVDEELAKARARVAAGERRASLYDAIVRAGLTSPQYVGAPAVLPPPPGAPVPAPADVAAVPPGADRTPSGLASRVLIAGAGTRHPGPTSRVEVHYTGWTLDGRMFDSSVQRGSPAEFPLNAVIRGWTEGVQLMVEGETRRVWIPASLAYGENPGGGRPGGMLVFDIQLRRILD